MRYTNEWVDFEVIDAGNGMKIERYGDVIIRRPEPVATWKPQAPGMACDAIYKDQWIFNKTLPESWSLTYKDLSFIVKPTQFKHTGIFPEQAVNWDWMRSVISYHKKPVRILNLFGYTGGATIACAKEENTEEIVHVDALKSAINWTKENITINNLDDKHIRTLVDDALKFLQKEKRRGRTYHGIIMDPPSFGRGPKGERWKIEDQLKPLIDAAVELLDRDAIFVVINTYTTNLTEKSVRHILNDALRSNGFPCNTHSEKIGLPISTMDQILPCGVTTRWSSYENIL